MQTKVRIWEQINPNNTASVFCLRGMPYRYRKLMESTGWEWIRSFDGTPGCYITHDRKEAERIANSIGKQLEVYDPPRATL